MDKKPPTQIQRSIAHDLYSEILQSSSVGLDRGSPAAQVNHNLHESDPDDLWYNDESFYEDSVGKLSTASDMEREWLMRHNQFHKRGYRDGLIAGKGVAAQEGFNIGFKDSVLTGYNWDLVRGITNAMACFPNGLKEKLVETRNKFKHVQSLSTTDALKLLCEDRKRKSSNHKESLDISVLENYHRHLQTLLGESRLLEGPLFNNNKRFSLITTVLITIIFLGSTFIPSFLDTFQFTRATAAVCRGFIFPDAITLKGKW